MSEARTPLTGEQRRVIRCLLEFAEPDELGRAVEAAGGPDFYDWEEQDCYPVHIAAKVEDGAALEALIRAGASLDVRDVHGYCPIHWSATMGFVGNVGRLIDGGCDPEARTLDKGSAAWELVWTRHWDRREAVKALVERALLARAGEGGAQEGPEPGHRL